MKTLLCLLVLLCPALVLADTWANYIVPALTGARGTLDCTSNTLVAAVGLRFVGTNGFSSLPIFVK